MIEHQELRRLIDYDGSTGIFTWRDRPELSRWWNDTFAGKQLGSMIKRGYIVITINNKRYFAHRVAWFWVHGYWPDCVDHVNFITTDNRIENLRSVTNAENARRRKLGTTSNTGYRGVYEVIRKYGMKRWQVEIKVDGKWVMKVCKTLEEGVALRAAHDLAMIGT